MKILYIDSNEPINNRNVKIIESLSKRKDIEIILATWKRNLEVKEYKYSVAKKYIFKKQSELGNRLKKIINLSSYYLFLRKLIKQENPDIIIASHYDILLLSSLIKQNNQYLIYENLDIPTSRNWFVLKLLQYVERFSLRKTDYITHASRFYPQLYRFFTKEQQVLENLPKLEEKNIFIKRGDKIVISFIGGIRYIDILIKLIEESQKFRNLELRLHGEGHERNKLQNYIIKNGYQNNVIMTGKYDYSTIPYLYLSSNFVWAVYPNDDYNVKFAISNKFHESIFFNVPGIYAKNTCLGSLVEKNEIGLIVDPNNRESISTLLDKISNNKINTDKIKSNMMNFKSSATNTWESEIDKLYQWILYVLNK